MRYVLPFPVLITALLTSFAGFGADDLSFELSLKDHQFTPPHLTIPADKESSSVSCSLRPRACRAGAYG